MGDETEHVESETLSHSTCSPRCGERAEPAPKWLCNTHVQALTASDGPCNHSDNK